jgi:hypothetical protein
LGHDTKELKEEDLYIYALLKFTCVLRHAKYTQSECSMPSNLCYAVPHNSRYIFLLENISLFQTAVRLRYSFSSFFLHPLPYSKPSLLNETALHYNVFTKLYTIKPAAGSKSVNAQRTSAVFPHQVLERIPAQETFIGCAGLHNINPKALNILSLYMHNIHAHIVYMYHEEKFY